MGLGTSLLLIAVGAVLRWAVTATASGINLHTVGLILVIIGLLGFIISVYWIFTAGDRADRVNPPDSYPSGRTPPQPRV